MNEWERNVVHWHQQMAGPDGPKMCPKKYGFDPWPLTDLGTSEAEAKNWPPGAFSCSILLGLILDAPSLASGGATWTAGVTFAPWDKHPSDGRWVLVIIMIIFWPWPFILPSFYPPHKCLNMFEFSLGTLSCSARFATVGYHDKHSLTHFRDTCRACGDVFR